MSRTISSFEEAQSVALSSAKKKAKKTLLNIFNSAGDFKFVGLFRQDTFSFNYRWEFNGEHGEDTAYIRILIDDIVTDEEFKIALNTAYEECKKLGEQRSNKGNKISTQKEQETLPALKKALHIAFGFISTNVSTYNANVALAERVYQLVWKSTQKDGNTIKGFKAFVKAIQAQLIKIQYDRDIKNGFYDEKEKQNTILFLPENIQPIIVEEVETEEKEVVDYSKYTVPEIKSILTEKNITFDKKAKKGDLIQLLIAV